ncbi:MAG TPA: sulfatase [Stenomitos sp.]
MKKANFFKLLLCTTFLSTLLVSLSSAKSEKLSKRSSTSKPNIVFILADDMTADEVKFMPHLKSNILDRGINFKNYFISVPLCCPSRTTIVRGQYSHNTNVKTNNYPDGGFLRFYETRFDKSTIATWLQGSGYNTALIGKYLNGIEQSNPRTYVPPGWSEWHSPINLFAAYQGFQYTLNENGTKVSYGTQPKDYGTDVYTKKANRFIEQSVAKKRPFFLFLSVVAPHAPAIPAPRHAELFPGVTAPRTPAFNEKNVADKPNYIQQLPLLNSDSQGKMDRLYRKRLQSLQAVDEAIQSLYITLKSTGQLHNTYLFFSSDNGYMFGQHRIPGGKSVSYEESIRVPLIVSGPGIPAGKNCQHLAGNIDLAPTFASLAKVSVPSFVDGRSLVPLLGKSSPSLNQWRQSYLLEHWPDSQSVSTYPKEQRDLTLEEQYINPKADIPIPEFHGIRTYKYSYVEYSTGERELYNLSFDPYQLTNIASRNPQLVKNFSARVNQLKQCKGNNCQIIENQQF